MLTPDRFLINLAAVLAHSAWYEHAQPLIDAGIPTGVFRNDMSPEAPPPRDMAQEGRDTLQAQIDLAPAQYAADAEFMPQYARLNRQLASDYLLGTGPQDRGFLNIWETNIAPTAQRVSEQSSTSQRTADIADVEALGSRAVQAFKAANPQQQTLLDEINRITLSDLQAGSNLTPGEQRLVQESVRTGQADRGMGFGPSDVFQEALATDQYGQARKESRMGQAYRTATLNQATSADPFTLVTGRASGAGGRDLWQTAMAGTANMGPQLTNPFNAYGSDLYNTNYNAQAAANIASANNNAALASAGIQAAGSMGSSM